MCDIISTQECFTEVDDMRGYVPVTHTPGGGSGPVKGLCEARQCSENWFGGGNGCRLRLSEMT
jgi:hypothetical protein